MKKIDGVDIKAAMEMATKEAEADRTRIVANAIKGLLADQWNLTAKIDRLKTDLAKAEGQLSGVAEKLAKVSAGDWGVLPEPKEPQAPKDNKGRPDKKEEED